MNAETSEEWEKLWSELEYLKILREMREGWVTINEEGALIGYLLEDWIADYTSVKYEDSVPRIETWIRIALKPERPRFPIGDEKLEEMLDYWRFKKDEMGKWIIENPAGIAMPEEGWVIDVGEVALRYSRDCEKLGIPSTIPPEKGIMKLLDIMIIEELSHLVGNFKHPETPSKWDLRRKMLCSLWDYL